ncbi:MAG: hypothetical protein HY367_02015 [Candidatus Aenigmarchaeota archaeon]|nr:hypothetical protein [Candidatus Aenigmarchaeota archaeon]
MDIACLEDLLRKNGKRIKLYVTDKHPDRSGFSAHFYAGYVEGFGQGKYVEGVEYEKPEDPLVVTLQPWVGFWTGTCGFRNEGSTYGETLRLFSFDKITRRFNTHRGHVFGELKRLGKDESEIQKYFRLAYEL